MSHQNMVYLDLAPFEEGQALRGGALIVDATTEPLEFRCTSAVRPTTLQRILWGQRLDGHIAASLLGLPLLRKMDHEYGLVVVRNWDFVEVRQYVDTPVILVTRDAELAFDEPDRRTNEQWAQDLAEGRSAESEALLANPSGRFESVILKPHAAYRDDRGTAREILGPVFVSRDVTEPFERVRTALNTVHTQGLGEEA